MRIIKHGDLYELGQQECSKYHCVFGFNKKDITSYRYIDYESYDRDEYDKNILYCPECNYTIDYYPPTERRNKS